MSNPKKRQSWPWWRFGVTALSALGLTFSSYLAWHYVVGGSVIGCDGGSPCDQVLSSRWSSVGGWLPVSGLAEGAYLAMLLASLYIGPATEASVRRLAWRAMLVLAGAAAGSAVWFTIVQKWFIGAFCPYCMATHLTGVLLAVLVIWRAPRQFDDDATEVVPTNPPPNDPTRTANAAPVQAVSPAAPQRVTGPWAAIGLALAGVTLAGSMAALQVGFAPPALALSGASQDNLPALDPHAVPLVGSPDAPYIVTLLFDYKCPHCQKVHAMLEEAVRRYGGKLAFALCPAPLSSECNPYIAGNVDAFKDSCELAKMGLAVWVARHDAFPAFDRWMFSPEPGDRWHPRSLDTVKAKAVELVGQAKFDAARADPWIDRHLQSSIRIFGHTLQDGNAVPKLVFGSRWVIPEPRDADDLVLMLQARLAVPRP